MTGEYEQEYVQRGADRLGVQVYPEPSEAGGPFVVVWPAMGVPARYYRGFAAQLRSAGLAVAVADLRGTGASTPAPSRRSSYGYADLADDVGAVLDHLGPRLEGRRVILLGHSLGGQASALYLARAPKPGVDALILVAVGLPWFRSYPLRRARGVLLLTQWINTVSAILRVWPGWGFGGRQARRVASDWAYTARHGRFPKVVAAEGLAGVRVPVLAISMDGDQYTPAATLDHLCAMMPAAEVRRVHLTTADIGTPVDHLSWARTSTPIAAMVAGYAGDLPSHPRNNTMATRSEVSGTADGAPGTLLP
jgi:predicted alpha/beta hydrolase